MAAPSGARAFSEAGDPRGEAASTIDRVVAGLPKSTLPVGAPGQNTDRNDGETFQMRGDFRFDPGMTLDLPLNVGNPPRKSEGTLQQPQNREYLSL